MKVDAFPPDSTFIQDTKAAAISFLADFIA